MNPLQEAAEIALRDCMGIKQDEMALILTDEPCYKIGRALYEVGKNLCREVFFFEMVPRKINGEEPPSEVAELM
jgi:aminopeptidase